jgi:hypothetical protein
MGRELREGARPVKRNSSGTLGLHANANRTAFAASYVPVSASIAAETCAAPQSSAGSERQWRDDPRQHEKRAQEIASYAWRVDRHQRSSDAFRVHTEAGPRAQS